MKCQFKLWIWIVSILLLLSLGELKSQTEFQYLTTNPVAILQGRDSTFLNPVYFAKDETYKSYFTSLLTTPVCNDTLCQLVRIRVNWDLIGSYIKFDTLEGYPLTKIDHQLFTETDYKKLHKTLKDASSILGRTSEAELLDDTQTHFSEQIEAYTGATSIQIKNSVVEGAMYSTYTLWHLVNGQIRQDLRNYTLTNYNSAIENQLLRSGNSNMILFALKQWDEQDYMDRFDEVILIMQNRNALVNFYISKNLSKSVFELEENRASIFSIWEILDANTRSILSQHIKPGIR
jgi:hypothetical protein